MRSMLMSVWLLVHRDDLAVSLVLSTIILLLLTGVGVLVVLT